MHKSTTKRESPINSKPLVRAGIVGTRKIASSVSADRLPGIALLSKIKSKGPSKIYLIPFIVNLYAPWVNYRPQRPMTAVEHALKMQDGSAIGFENDPTLLIVRGLAYFFALALVVSRFPASLAPLRRNPLYGVLVLYVLLSTAWSMLPSKVFVNFGHLAGLGFILLNLDYYFRDRISDFYVFLAKVFFPLILASLFMVVFFPAYGINIPDAPGLAGRWLGIMNNSNTLGSTAMISVWANLAAWRVVTGRYRRVFVTISFILSFIAVLGSRSSTATVLSLFCLIAIPLFLSFENNTTAVRFIKLGAAAAGLLVLLALTVVVAPERLEATGFFALLGRTATLSGRTHLWEHAFTLIEARPFTGWSFDSNVSLISSTSAHPRIGGGQFHNGYLDLMVRGGIIGICILIPMILSIIIGLIRYSKVCFRDSVLLLIFTIEILLHNVTEASFVRETSPLWMSFVFIYYVCAEFQNRRGSHHSIGKENGGCRTKESLLTDHTLPSKVYSLPGRYA